MAGEAVLHAVEAASEALGALGAAYTLIGGAALPAWGRVRATADADILISVRSPRTEDLAAIVDALRAAGFAHMDRADRKQIEDKSVLHFGFPIRDRGFSIRLDVIAAEGTYYDDVISRSAVRRIDGISVRVASCEDLILLKLAAGRPVDLVDAQELLVINRATLDMTYLGNCATHLKLATELRALLAST